MSDKKTFDETIELLLPQMSEVNGRRALVESALFGCPVLNSIDWSGAPHVFTVHLVRTLLTFGECKTERPAIVMLLEELKGQVGVNQHSRIDSVIKNYLSKATDSIPQTQGPQTLMQVPGFLFLIDVGRWAMSELNERWTLRRKEQSITLDDEQKIRQAEPGLTQAVVSEKGQPLVDRTLERIQAKRDLIEGWKDALVDDQKDQMLGNMSSAILNAKKRDYNSKIQATMGEIESDLRGLGLTIEKSA